MNNPIYIITGEQGKGKTSFLEKMVAVLRSKGFQAGGIIARGTWKNDSREKFELVDLQSGQKIVFCQREPVFGWIKTGHFFINPEGQVFGEKALHVENLKHADMVVFDEIGPFEMEGKGWANALLKIMHQSNIPVILTVRESLVNRIIDKWDLNPGKIFRINETDYTEAVEQILKDITER